MITNLGTVKKLLFEEERREGRVPHHEAQLVITRVRRTFAVERCRATTKKKKVYCG